MRISLNASTQAFAGIKSLEINLAGQPTSERHRTPILHRFPVLNTVCDLFTERLLATSQLPIVWISIVLLQFFEPQHFAVLLYTRREYS